MFKHITPSTTGYGLFRKYFLSVKIYTDADEERTIREHRLGAIEVFADPVREEFESIAAAAHAKAGAHGIIVFRARDSAAIAASELRALYSTMRATCAFKVRVSDLLHGVVIQHRSLRAIEDTKLIMVEFIDRLDAAVRSARSYSDRSEELYAPGTDEPDDGVPPGEWARTWRR